MHAPARVHTSTNCAIHAVSLWCLLAWTAWTGVPQLALADEGVLAFAVVSEPPRDKARISAKVAIEGSVANLTLLASDQILSNPIWKTLEVCHAMKLEGQAVREEFRVASVRVIDSAMLPMVLQGFAGDCLLKKALDAAPFAD